MFRTVMALLDPTIVLPMIAVGVFVRGRKAAALAVLSLIFGIVALGLKGGVYSAGVLLTCAAWSGVILRVSFARKRRRDRRDMAKISAG